MEPIAHNGTATSIAAAERIRPDAHTMRALVLEAIAAAGYAGLTRDEVAAKLDMNPNTVRPRCVELRRRGKIIDTDRKRRGCGVMVAAEWAQA